MITIRNPTECQSLTVIADTALVVGQVVKLMQAAVAGDPCKVGSPIAADYKDVTMVLGIVYFVPDNSEAVDYIVDPNNGSLVVNTGADGVSVIPDESLCTFWFDRPIIAYTVDSFTADVGATIAVTTREGAVIAANTFDHLMDIYDAADVNGSDVPLGVVYRNDGAEITILFSNL